MNDDIGIVIILRERLHQIDRLRDNFGFGWADRHSIAVRVRKTRIHESRLDTCVARSTAPKENVQPMLSRASKAKASPVTWQSCRVLYSRRLMQRLLRRIYISTGNHLEEMKGDRIGQNLVQINGHWRICFVWTSQVPADVEIVDYH